MHWLVWYTASELLEKYGEMAITRIMEFDDGGMGEKQ